MIHSKFRYARIFPWISSRAPEQIDRVQEFSADQTLTQTKLYEHGRDGKLGVKKEIPSVSVSMRQFEFGSMAFFRSMANIVDPASGGLDESIDLDDLKSTRFDIAAYLTDDDGTFRGTEYFQNLRLNGFSLNISDPDAIVERNFDLVGEDMELLDGEYLDYETGTVVDAGDYTLALDPTPVEYASGKYVLKVIRVRAGVATKLIEDTSSPYADNTWRYSAGSIIVQDCLTDDIIKAYYPAATAYGTLWTNNDSDVDMLTADSAEVYLKVGTETRIYRLQSVGIDVSFERADYKEIGNSEVVQRGVKSKTVTVALDRFNEGYSLEDILASDTTYPYINPRDFASTIQLMVKIFTDKTHTTFKMGYLITSLSPTSLGTSHSVEDYGKMTTSLESDNLKISNSEDEIVFV